MEWIVRNWLSLLTLVLVAIVLYQQIELKDMVDDARKEASFTNSKLDIVESDINSKK